MATYRFLRAFTASPDRNVLAFLRGRLDDCLGIVDRHVRDRSFVVGGNPTVADLSMAAYLSFAKEETGYDLAATHPAIHAWLARIAALANWRVTICSR